MCLHVQFPEGVWTSGLGIPTYEGVSGEESTWDDERLTREYDLLRSFGDSQGSLLGKNSSFSLWLTGELVLILPIEGSCLLHGEISSQLKKGCLYALDLPRGGGGGWSFHDTILYWGFG